jgi:uncharacterized membrane protein (GlpM family)
MNLKTLVINFLIGGTVVSLATYFGSHSKGLTAALISMLPSISVVTFCSVYLASGTGAAVSYARGVLIILPSWLLYMCGMIFLLPRLGLIGSLTLSIGAYLAAALLLSKLAGYFKI